MITRYREIPRLFTDDNPRNTFRNSTYISVTGGGGGSTQSLSFLTDIKENRAQRKACGELLRRLNVLSGTDCVLSLHPSGKMYRYVSFMRKVGNIYLTFEVLLTLLSK